MFCFESAAQAVYLVSALDFKLRGPGLRLAGITTLCFWTRQLTHTMLFSTWV